MGKPAHFYHYFHLVVFVQSANVLCALELSEAKNKSVGLRRYVSLTSPTLAIHIFIQKISHFQPIHADLVAQQESAS